MTLGQLTDRVSAAIWNLHPEQAVRRGKHQYDGQVPDLSAPAVEAGIERLGRLREQVAALSGLAPDEERERRVLLGVVDRERFDCRDARRWRRDPAWYLGAFDVAVYLERDYAPPGLRLERAAGVLGEAGGVLAAARQNLEAGLPRAWVERAVSLARAHAAALETHVGGSPAARAAPEEAAWLVEAARYAAGELEAYAAWLEAEAMPAAVAAFALGEAGLEEWLRAAEGLDWRAADLASIGAALLEEDGAGPGAGAEHAAAPVADPLGALREAVEGARRFVAGAGLVSLPTPGKLEVSAGFRPPAGGAGWLQAPGPYDDPATIPILYLSSGGAGHGRGALEDLAVTAAYPGSFLLARASGGAPGEARKRFPSRAFRAGWASYAADLMAEAGFGEGHPQWPEAARRRTLREDCRLVCVAGLHAGEMTLEEAGTLFTREAGLSEGAARAEALDAAADPGRAAAAVGRAVFRRLRRDRGEPGGAVAVFHDGLLSGGALPVGLLDRLPA